MKLRITRSKHFKIVKNNLVGCTSAYGLLMAVDFFDLDRLFVKDEIPEYSPPLTLK